MAITTKKVTLSLDAETYKEFCAFKKENNLSISARVRSKMQTKFYVLETDRPFICLDKIFNTVEEAVLEADKSEQYSGVVQGQLIWMN